MNSVWDERYAVDDYVYGTEPNEFLVSVADCIPPGPVLCLAEGEGRNAVYLAGKGHAVEALDGSAVGLEKAQRLARARGVTLRTHQCDLEDYVLAENSWSGIVLIFCHLPPELRRKVHASVVKGLVPSGVVVLEAYTPTQLQYRTGGPSTPELLYRLDDLREDFRALELTRAEELVRPVYEGLLHRGNGAVVQLLARCRS